MDTNIGTDLKEIERKIGRKIPESLLRAVMERQSRERSSVGDKWNSPGHVTDISNTSLQSKVHLLRQELSHLRGVDVRLLCQLLMINDGIEATRWALEVERGLGLAAVASRECSLAGSLCSLAEIQEASPRSSVSSPQYGSDGFDAVSLGSFLDTLAEDPTTPAH
ncbi:hypothetical protein UPYG_G00048600 [Umbra pygmaea]|uniref:Leucine rich adaptor protein 1-like n=1 Tax=Umbra pygmaea TaxID=75934 RepID=A0ABD0XU31_UMBPY